MTKKELSNAVKKGLLGSAHNAELCFPPGFRDAAMQEARHITENLHTPRKFETQVVFENNALYAKNISFDNLLEITLRARVIWDVKMEILRKRCPNFHSLHESLEKMGWENFFLPQTPLLIKSLAQASVIENARKVRDSAKEILEKKGFPCVSEPTNKTEETQPIPLHINVEKNVLHISLSLAGNPLYMRGYRALTSSLAPLREDIAAGCIKQCLHWAKPALPPHTIYAPFAGSGTLGFEAILEFLAVQESDNQRGYAFQNLTAYREASYLWLKRKLKTTRRESATPLRVAFVERDETQHEELLANIRFFENHFALTNANIVCDAILGDVFDSPAQFEQESTESVFVAMNPPFGIRMGKGIASVPAFFNRIGKHIELFARHFTQRDRLLFGFVLCPCEESWSAFLKGSPSLETKTVHFMLGGRDIRLCLFKTQTTAH
jgi:23S rRNA G2445 N2-methylase RlmL